MTRSAGAEAPRPARRRYRRALREVALGEGRAYGFALVIWTVGAIVTHQHGAPGIGEAVAYLGGALAGVGLTIAAAFAPDVAAAHAGGKQVRLGLGLLHILSVAAGVAVGGATGAAAPGPSAFFVAPLGAVLVYQFAMAVEVALTSRDAPADGRGEGEPADWREPAER